MMKKIRTIIGAWVDNLDERWQHLSLQKQRRYVLYSFLVYLLLTATVLLKVSYDTIKSRHSMSIAHINNPVVLPKKPDASIRDSISKKLNKKIYVQ